MSSVQNIRATETPNGSEKPGANCNVDSDGKCPLHVGGTCAYKLFEAPRKTCTHSQRFHCNPCCCCCCFGGFCNLRKNGILVAALEIIGGIFLSITASALYFHIGGLMNRSSIGDGPKAQEYRMAYKYWQSAASSLALVGMFGLIGGSALLYATFIRNIPACYINILLELVAVIICWCGVLFVFLALNKVWKIFQEEMTREQALQLYDDQLYGLLGAILTATAATMVLLYFIACVIGLALQMRAGVENNPFYSTYFGSTVYLTTCTQCYEEARPKKSCWPCGRGGLDDSFRKIAPVEVEFVDDGPSTAEIAFPQNHSGLVSRPDDEIRAAADQQRKLSDGSTERQRKASSGSSADRQQDVMCGVNFTDEHGRRNSGARRPPTGRKFEWPEGCAVCDFRRLPKYNRNSI